MSPITPARPRQAALTTVEPTGLIAVVSLMGTVRVVGVLEIPERPAAADDGYDFEVVGRRWRGRGPLERPGVPGVGAGERPRAQRPHDVHHEDDDPGDLQRYAEGRDEVPDLPAAAGLVRVDPPGHAQQPGDVHRHER